MPRVGRQHEPAVFAGGRTIALIRGLTFAVSDPSGEIDTGHEGIIAGDTRHLSRLTVRVDSAPVESVGAAVLAPHLARFAGMAATRDASPDAPLEVHRLRCVEEGRVVEDIELHWWGSAARDVTVAVCLDADFADIFEVRALDAQSGGPRRRHPVVVEWTERGVRFIEERVGLETIVACDPPPCGRTVDGLTWTAPLRRAGTWRLRLVIDTGNASGVDVETHVVTPEPVVHTAGHPLARACAISLADLDALSLPDPVQPTRTITTAGIPWFVALFGRDSLITARQARAFRPQGLLDALSALAARQGSVVDPTNEEQPGKILHEVRLTRRPWLQTSADGQRPYYGSVDATPLFLMAYGSAWRWGAPRSAISALLPAARAALAWMRGAGDPDGDGLLEYGPSTSRSLRNQGWKDSENGIQAADGTLPEGPIAVVEAQAYAYRGRLDLAEVLRDLGEDEEAREIEAEAATLLEAIRTRFWRPAEHGEGWFAVALDGDKRQVDALTSNIGHVLWCGVPDAEQAAAIATHLVSPDLFTGWGVRTLAASMAGYNPNGYHSGSVWPHDTAIACDALRRYGYVVESHRLAEALLDAMAAFELRLPELFGGHAREQHAAPIPYPTACRPQAWAAGVPLQLAATFLGIESQLGDGRITLRPSLPPSLVELGIHGMAFPTGVLSVVVRRGGATEVVEAPRGVVVEIAGE